MLPQMGWNCPPFRSTCQRKTSMSPGENHWPGDGAVKIHTFISTSPYRFLGFLSESSKAGGKARPAGQPQVRKAAHWQEGEFDARLVYLGVIAEFKFRVSIEWFDRVTNNIAVHIVRHFLFHHSERFHRARPGRLTWRFVPKSSSSTLIKHT